MNPQASVSGVMAWRCTVCGYIHRGKEPPAECPVCGAPASEFEPHQEDGAKAAATAAEQWRCLNCAYIHKGTAPPETCVVCGEKSDRFEPFAGSGGSAAQAAAPGGRIVILGAGIAGVSAAEAMRQSGSQAQITLVSRESGLPYYRLNLTRYLAGEIVAAALPIHPESWYKEQRVELLAGREASALHPAESSLVLATGEKLKYDKLILTAGAHPFIPPFPGAQLEGVTPLRTQADADRILQIAGSGAACVVIGGGILGLETAGGIARRGGKVTLLESHEWLMPRQLSRRAGELLAAWINRLGIKLRTQAATERLLGEKHVNGVLLKDGTVIPADLAILTTGVRPNSHLARQAGLEVAQGVVVDNHMTSSVPNILAAGDIAEHRGVLYGNWMAAQFQGAIAGMNAVGKKTEFGGIPRSNTLKALGLDLVSIGKFEPEDGSYLVFEQEKDAHYARYVFRDNRLVGAILLADASLAGVLKRAMENKRDFSDLLRGSATAQKITETLAAEK